MHYKKTTTCLLFFVFFTNTPNDFIYGTKQNENISSRILVSRNSTLALLPIDAIYNICSYFRHTSISDENPKNRHHELENLYTLFILANEFRYDLNEIIFAEQLQQNDSYQKSLRVVQTANENCLRPIFLAIINDNAILFDAITTRILQRQNGLHLIIKKIHIIIKMILFSDAVTCLTIAIQKSLIPKNFTQQDCFDEHYNENLLQLAIIYHAHNCFTELLGKGNSIPNNCPQIRDINNNNLLHLSVVSNNSFAIRKIKEHPYFNELLRQPNNFNQTPLQLAAAMGYDTCYQEFFTDNPESPSTAMHQSFE